MQISEVNQYNPRVLQLVNQPQSQKRDEQLCRKAKKEGFALSLFTWLDTNQAWAASNQPLISKIILQSHRVTRKALIGMMEKSQQTALKILLKDCAQEVIKKSIYDLVRLQVENNDTQSVHALIKELPVEALCKLFEKCLCRMQAMHTAMKNNDSELIDLIIEKCPQSLLINLLANNKDCLPALLKSGNFNALKLLLAKLPENCAAHFLKFDKQGNSVLSRLIESDQVELFDVIYQKHPQWVHKNLRDLVQLKLGAKAIDRVCVFFEKMPAAIKEVAFKHGALLQLAINSDHFELVKWFCYICPSHLRSDLFDSESLICAVRSGDMALVRFMLERCPPQVKRGLFKPSVDGETALHAAAQGGELEIINLICDECHADDLSDLFQKDTFGRTPLYYSAKHPKEIIQAIIERCPKRLLPECFREKDILCEAAAHSDAAAIELLLDACPDKHYSRLFRAEALHAAAKSGRAENIQAVLNGCPPKHLGRLYKINWNSKTPLQIVVENGSPEACQAVLEGCPWQLIAYLYGAYPEPCKQGGEIPLHVAAVRRLENLPILLKHAPQKWIHQFYDSASYRFLFKSRAPDEIFEKAVIALCEACPKLSMAQFFAGGRNNKNLLYYAVLRGNVGAVQTILDKCPAKYYDSQFKAVTAADNALAVTYAKQEVVDLLMQACPEELRAEFVTQAYYALVRRDGDVPGLFKAERRKLDEALDKCPTTSMRSDRMRAAIALGREGDIKRAGDFLFEYQAKYSRELEAYVWENRLFFSEELDKLPAETMNRWPRGCMVFLPILMPSLIQRVSPKILRSVLDRKIRVGDEERVVFQYLNLVVTQLIEPIDWSAGVDNNYIQSLVKSHLSDITLVEWARLAVYPKLQCLAYKSLKLMSEPQIAVVLPNISSDLVGGQVYDELCLFLQELGGFEMQRRYIPYATPAQKEKILQQICWLPPALIDWEMTFEALKSCIHTLKVRADSEALSAQYTAVCTKMSAIVRWLEGFRHRHDGEAVSEKSGVKSAWNVQRYEDVFLSNEVTPSLGELLETSMQALISSLSAIEHDMQALMPLFEQLKDKFEGSVPDEFLDQVTCEVMRNPLQFPDAQGVIDESTLERLKRNEMGEIQSPFNRQFYKMDDLVPAAELKKKLDQYWSSV